MSLSQRLRQLQIPTAVPTENLDHLTLQDLAQEVISFGAKHQGHTYEETWNDQEWVQFMVSRFQASTKESHRRFLKYVELKVESLERGQEVIPQEMPSNRPKARAKPAAKSIATPVHTSLPDGDEDWDFEPEMYAPPTTTGSGGIMQEDMNALQQRMLYMENALSRVIAYIENQNPPQIESDAQ
eukprot:s5225_g2.t1